MNILAHHSKCPAIDTESALHPLCYCKPKDMAARTEFYTPEQIAWAAGHHAYDRGEETAVNPHNGNTHLWLSWIKGWRACEERSANGPRMEVGSMDRSRGQFGGRNWRALRIDEDGLDIPEYRECDYPDCCNLVPTDARGYAMGYTVIGGEREDLLFCSEKCAEDYEESKRPY